MRNRRQPTTNERLTPCECCGHPLSQRHHLLQVAYYGENDVTVQLCANCHELLHLAIAANNNPHYDEEAFMRGEKKFGMSKSQHLWGSFILSVGFGSGIVYKIVELVRHTEELEKEMNRKIIEAVKNAR